MKIPALHLGMLLFLLCASSQFVRVEAQTPHSAIRLNGNDAFGSAAGVGALVSNSTWEAWVRIPHYEPTIVGPGIVLSRWGMWTSGSPLVWVADGACQGAGGYANPGEGNPGAPAGTLSAGLWHHIATVFGPEANPGWTTYVDGQQVEVVASGGNAPSGGWETDLGCWGNVGYGGFLKADVDEARLSDIPRYSANFTPPIQFSPDANTVALWHFDEAAGGVAHDATGNGFDFTLHGGFSWVDGVGGPPFLNYCAAKPNSLGCLPSIGASGSTSLTGPDDLIISAHDVLGDTNGMMLWSCNPASTPFHGGTLCIAPPIVRTPLQNSGHAGSGTCPGTYGYAFTHAYAASQLLQPGTQICAQYYSRDPGFPTPDSVGLTDGVQFFLTP